VSEIAIPFDQVDEEAIASPVKWDVKFIEHFMLVFGPVSSVFDFLTFYALLHVFDAGEALFHTGWFMESITTQVLVVFAIRTRRWFFSSRPNGFLVAMAAAVVAVAIGLPLLPVGRWFGFVAPPPLFFVFLIGATIAYLCSSHERRMFISRRPCVSLGLVALSDLSKDGRCRRLVEAMANYVIYIPDPEGIVWSWNADAQRFKRYDASEIIGCMARLNHADNARVITTGILRQNPEKIAETSSGEVSPRNFRGFHTVCKNYAPAGTLEGSWR
jgi:Cation transporting ATPase, C-terminus